MYNKSTEKYVKKPGVQPIFCETEEKAMLVDVTKYG